MIFILGGNGFVGSGYVRTLAARGLPFEVITRDNYAQFVGRSCDIFINANGNSSKLRAKEDAKGEFQASVASVRNSLEDFKFQTYVFLSTSDIYPDCTDPDFTRESSPIDVARLSPYGFHKFLAEQCVQHVARRYLIIRQGGFVGPEMKKNAVFDVMSGDKIWVHPESRFQFMHTDDSARAVMKIIEAGVSNEVVNVTARGTVSVAELMIMHNRYLSHAEDAMAITYELSLEKALKWVDLPATVDCVKNFLHQMHASKRN